MTKAIVSDTGPLIALALTDLLNCLPHFFDQVLVPDSVFKEATNTPSLPGASKIGEAYETGLFQVQAVSLSPDDPLLTILDQGEADAICLARIQDALLLIDERKGKKAAIGAGLKITGTAALMIKAKEAGLIDSVRPLLERLNQHGYRLSASLVRVVLERCGEGE